MSLRAAQLPSVRSPSQRNANLLHLLAATLALASSARAQVIPDWASGLPPVTSVTSTATLNLTTTSGKTYDTTTITNSGTINWQGGTVSSTGGAIVNNSGATFNDNASSTLSGTATFTNNGTFNKLAGNTTSVAQTFDNNGSVVVSSGNLSLSGGGTSSGNVTIGNAASRVTVGSTNYTFSGGSTLNGPGALEIASATTTFSGSIGGSANIVVSGGTAVVTGTTTLSGGGTLSGGILNGTGTLTLGNTVTLNGTSLTGAGTLNANGGAAITSSFSINSSRSLNLSGNSTWSAGYIYAGGGSNLTVQSGASLTTNFDGTLNGTYYSGGNASLTTQFNNQGTFTKSSGASNSSTDIGATLNNTGTINVQAGTLALGGGGTHTGNVNVSSGATLALTGGTHTFGSGAQINGTGNLKVSGGESTFNGATTGTANIVLAGGNATFSGTTSTSGGGTFSGGMLAGTGALTLANTVTLNGTSLTGAGTLNANGGASLAGSFSINSSRSLNLSGSSTWSSGYLYAGGGSSFTVQPTATFTTDFDGTLNGTYYSGGNASLTTVFNNQGTFTKSSGASNSSTDISATLNNTGAINVQAGTLALGGGGTHTGTVNVSSGATLALTGGTHTFGSGAQINGTGNLKVSGGDSTFNGATTGTANIVLAGGNATFSGTTSTSGGGTFSGGTLAGTGTITLGNAVTLNGTSLTGAGTINANGGAAITSSFSINSSRSLNLSGSSTWSSGYIYAGGGSAFTVKPGATLATDFDGTLNGTYYNSGNATLTTQFNNQGTFTKSAGTGTTGIQAVFNNSGAVNVQSGTLSLSGGGSATAGSTFTVGSGAALTFGGGTHSLASGASLSGAGAVNLTSGSVAIASGSAQFATLNLSSGTLDGAGTAAIGALNQTGGSAALAALTLTGTSTWNGGDWHGASGSTASIASGATLNLGAGSYHDFNRRAVTNSGTVNWSSGYIRSSNGGSFTNAAGATFNDLLTAGYTITNPSFDGTAGTFSFTNNGTYVRNGSGTSYVDVPFYNNGTVSVQQGDLHFRAGGSLASGGTITAAAGTGITFTNGFAIANGASLGGAGGYYLTGGTLDLNGTVAISNLTQTGGMLVGTNVLNALVHWQGGDWNAPSAGATTTIASGATLNLGNGSYHDFNQRGIVNQGTVNWSSGYLRSGNGGSFVNVAGATFNDLLTSGYSVTNPSFNGTAGTFSFTNNGTYIRNGSGASYVDVPFDNNGTVSLVAGDLHFRAGGTLATAGSIAAAGGTNVYFTSGYTVNDGASLSGAGTYWLTGGTFAVTGRTAVGTFNQTGGVLGGSGTLAGIFNWTGGDWNAATPGSTTAIANGATLNLGNGSYHDFNRRAVTNQGTVNWSGGYLRSGNGGSFTNAAGATFNDQNASGYSVSNGNFGGTAGTFVFANAGTYVRNVAGTTYFDTTFDNTGTVNLQQGSIQVRGGGTMGAAGVVNASAGATLQFTNDYTIQDGATFAGAGAIVHSGGTLTLNGVLKAPTFNWHGGDWNAPATGVTTTVAATTTLNLGAGSYHDFNRRAIVNQGTVNWSSGYVRSGNGGSFTNAAGATFNDLNASSYTIYNGNFGGTAGTFEFVNNGTYVRNAAGTTYLDVPFNNNGTVNLLGGDLQFRGGGTMGAGAIVNAAAGTTLYLADNYTVQTGAQFAGAGTFKQTGGTLTLDGTLKASNFNWADGNWNGTGTSRIDATTTLNFVSGGYKDFAQRAIVNDGTVNWESGYLRGGNGSTFTNASGGVFNDLNASSYSVYNPSFGGTAGTFVFANHGTYVRNAGGTTYFDTTFDNHGTLDVRQGNLQLRGGGTMSAASVATVAASAALYLDGNYTLLDGARFAGAGLVDHSGGTLTLNGSLRAAAFTWSGGTWNAATAGLATTVASGTVLNLTASHDGYRDFRGRQIVNEGVVNWSSGYLRSGDGGAFTNAAGATFNDLNASGYTIYNPFTGGFTFTNAGTYNKTTGGTTSVQVPFANSGTLNVAGGSLVFTSTFANTGAIALANGAHLYLSAPASFGSGRLGGTGTIHGSVTAGGIVAPGNSAGTLAITDALTLLGTSTLLIELGGATQGTGYDYLSVGGAAALGGNLSLSFLNGYQGSILISDTFTILTSASLTGVFANVANGATLATSDGAGFFRVNYGAGSPFATTSVVLSNFQAVPEPSTYALLGLGSLAVLATLRRRRQR